MTNTETNTLRDILRRAAIAVLPVVAASFLGQSATSSKSGFVV